jgi:tetratricopeptide (TPR) repeat protein
MAGRTGYRAAGRWLAAWIGCLGFVIAAGFGCAARSERPAPPRLTEARRLAAQGSSWYRQGCVTRAEQYFYQALEASRLVDDVEGMVRAHNNLAVAAMAQGYYDEASVHLNRAWVLNDRAKSTEEGPLILGNLGSLAYKMGRYREAEDFWRQALAAAEAGGGRSALVLHLNNLGMLMRQDGRLAEAETMLRRALSLTGESEEGSTGNTHFQLALLAQTRGDPITAERHLSMALALDRGAENPRGIAQDLEQLGILHQRQQSWDRAAGELDRAIRLYAALGSTGNVEAVFRLLEANREASGIPESLDVYRGLLVPPGEEWESPLCQ